MLPVSMRSNTGSSGVPRTEAATSARVGGSSMKWRCRMPQARSQNANHSGSRSASAGETRRTSSAVRSSSCQPSRYSPLGKGWKREGSR